MPDFLTPVYIISQFAALIAFTAALASYHLKEKSQIFGMNAAANVFDMIHYGLLGGWSAVAVKVMALIRNIFMIQQSKHEVLKHIGFMVGFIVIYIAIGVFTFQSWYSLLPLVSAVVYMCISWNGDPIKIKLVAFICYWPWLIYNICIFSIVGSIACFVSLISSWMAYRNEVKAIEAEKNKIWVAGVDHPVDNPED